MNTAFAILIIILAQPFFIWYVVKSHRRRARHDRMKNTVEQLNEKAKAAMAARDHVEARRLLDEANLVMDQMRENLRG